MYEAKQPSCQSPDVSWRINTSKRSKKSWKRYFRKIAIKFSSLDNGGVSSSVTKIYSRIMRTNKWAIAFKKIEVELNDRAICLAMPELRVVDKHWCTYSTLWHRSSHSRGTVYKLLCDPGRGTRTSLWHY